MGRGLGLSELKFIQLKKKTRFSGNVLSVKMWERKRKKAVGTKSRTPNIIVTIRLRPVCRHYYILQNLIGNKIEKKRTEVRHRTVTGNGNCEIRRRETTHDVLAEPFAFSFFGPIQHKTIYRLRTLPPAVGSGRKSGHVYTLSGQTKMPLCWIILFYFFPVVIPGASTPQRTVLTTNGVEKMIF